MEYVGFIKNFQTQSKIEKLAYYYRLFKFHRLITKVYLSVDSAELGFYDQKNLIIEHLSKENSIVYKHINEENHIIDNIDNNKGVFHTTTDRNLLRTLEKF